ncbi:efflux transporter periplasmic adaptor subunit [Thioclava sp. DLFJ5-1]|uniref:efflux RND transporter periplasmic adaptor subunit n=1 Tax=Thioclava sp. DLFJ5-1 TaxID=1915314 RepID=UPI000996F40C|nr:efflux RND transporter periplasmic adaptor subunit [Thioclava sp. DLFJ5-1]OOY21731.1 efflux transporter periplasmic adaptor subunit [Thioclava sp. DLFJ5-1]
MSIGRIARRAAFGMLLAGGFAAQALAQGMPGGTQGPTEVGVKQVETQSVPYTVTLPGRAVAFEQTDIRPRVAGTIASIDYGAGHKVATGDALFHIDDDTYQAELTAAEAEKAGADANVQAAQSQVDRYTKLEKTSISVSDLETARVALAQAKASALSADADLQTAQLNLDRTVIRSPIDGYPDVASVSVGSLVTANQSDALTTVTRLDPIYVDVSESAARIMRVRQRIDQGTLQRGDQLKVSLLLETGAEYDGTGTLVSPGATVSATTGTVDFRFKFDNPDRLILPGQFLRAKITLGTTQAILVPQRATTREGDGTLSAFIAADGAAKKVKLTTAGTYQNAWIVTDGIESGDQVILDGLKNLRDGAEIKTVPVTINAQGVVKDAADSSDNTADTAKAE